MEVYVPRPLILLSVPRIILFKLILILLITTTHLPCRAYLRFQKVNLILGLLHEGYKIYHGKPDLLLIVADASVRQTPRPSWKARDKG